LAPVVVLRIAYAKGEYGVGQLAAVPIQGMNADEHRAILSSLNIAGINFRHLRTHGAPHGWLENWWAGEGGVSAGSNSPGPADNAAAGKGATIAIVA
jgi:hypothetical protein